MDFKFKAPPSTTEQEVTLKITTPAPVIGTTGSADPSVVSLKATVGDPAVEVTSITGTTPPTTPTDPPPTGTVPVPTRKPDFAPGNNLTISDKPATWNVLGTNIKARIAAETKDGRPAIHYEVRRTDSEFAGGLRAELTYYNKGPYPIRYRYKISYWVPQTWIDDPIGLADCIHQFHDEGGSLKSPLDFNIDGTRWKANVRWGTGQEKAIFLKTPVAKGRWVDFFVDVKFVASGNGGWLRIWKDGVQEVDYSGPLGYPDKETSPYFKNGIYKWPWNKNEVPPQKTPSTQHDLWIGPIEMWWEQG